MTEKICRLCTACPSICFSLLENNFSEMLEALTSIKVNANDVMSTISCVKCLLNMKLAFNIQQNILKADRKLKELTLLNNVEVKLEEIDITLDKENITGIHLSTELNTPTINERTLNLSFSNCIICGVEVENTLLAKHVEEHFTDKQSCDCCNKSFSSISEYRGHVAHEHKQYKNISHKCQKCGATFRYKSLYNIHMKHAHQNVSNTRMCKKEFQFKRQLADHAHQKKKCPICNAEISKNNFKKHVQNHSSGQQICELCGASLRSLESLRGHLSHTHSSAMYTCEKCGKVFRKKYPFLLHMKKHSGEKTHICETCGKSFLTFFYLNKHIKTAHLKLRPFICEYCHKCFCSKFALKTHIRQHTNETPYRCEVCGEGFRQNVSLRAHRKSKHNIIEAKTCACPVCGKLFSSDQAIASHMRLH